MADVAVVGGGVGGLAAAIRLRAAGHGVVLLERSDVVGGKLATYRRDGFAWETGPSLLTLPQVFDDLLALADTSLATACQPVRLDPSCRYHFADGSTFATRDDPAATAAEVEALSPGSQARWAGFHRRSRRVWEVAERTFFTGPIEDPRQLVGRMRSPVDLLAIDPFPTLHARASRSFADPRLVQWVDRYATYSGSSPFRVPATLACIPHIEQVHGAWYLRGGLATLADGLGAAARRLGVDVRTGVEVQRITDDGGAVTGVRLAGGQHLAADVVVADVDAALLYGRLLPDAGGRRRTRAAGRSTSGFVLLLGVAGGTDGLAHHTISFSHDYRAEFDQLRNGLVPHDPTIYVCDATLTDPAQAPAGHEALFVLVNVPATTDAAAWADGGAAYGDHVLAVLARRGFDLRERVVVREQRTPADIERAYAAVGGAIYGTSSDGRRAAFTRPANRGRRRGLYLAGGSSHPGGGLPLVALSARIVADMVAADGW